MRCGVGTIGTNRAGERSRKMAELPKREEGSGGTAKREEDSKGAELEQLKDEYLKQLSDPANHTVKLGF